jgi:8-oxo-dGTP pyrophosphatase MutT (NUDIX family)
MSRYAGDVSSGWRSIVQAAKATMTAMTGSFEVRLRAALQEREPRLTTVPDARDAAVLIPIVGSPEPTLVFTVRTDNLPSHKGQISFPGGSIDPDDASPEAAALREAHEELGIDARDVRVLGRLDSVPTFVSGYVIHPVVGWIDEPPQLTPSSAEVAAVLEVPVAELSDEIRAEPGAAHGGRTYPTEAWVWNDRVIWGATARVIRLFLECLAAAGLAPAPGGAAAWPPDPVGSAPGSAAQRPTNSVGSEP